MALTPEQMEKLTRLKHLQSFGARVEAIATDLQGKIDDINDNVIKGVKVNGAALTPTGNIVDVLMTMEKKATAEAGYASSYVFKANGVAVGDTINIAKDWLLTGVEKGVVTAADKAAGGKFENDDDFAVGDKYIDFSFNVKAGGEETTTHIYLNVQDLVDAYLAGNGLALDSSTNTFSVVIDSNNANGLSVGAGGIALDIATDSTPGAMSAADHAKFTAGSTKLAGISEQANKTTVTAEGSGAIEIDGTTKTVVYIATDAEVAEMLDAVLPAPSNS